MHEAMFSAILISCVLVWERSISEDSLRRYVQYASESCIQELLMSASVSVSSVSGPNKLGNGGGDGWKILSLENGVEISKRRSGSLHIFRSRWVLRSVSPQQFITVANAIDAAKQWDSELVEARYIKDLEENLSIIRLRFGDNSKPLFRKREFIVYERRETMEDGTLVVAVASLPKEIAAGLLPQQNNAIRGLLLQSGWVVEKLEDINSCIVTYVVQALTTDVDKFYQQCDPEKENLCLYGLPNETWEVNLPVEEVPPELPEPALGINFARDGMQEKDWLSLVAVHSDSWLLSVAFYFGARFGFGKNERKRLFLMINDLPSIFEVVTGNAKPSKDQSANHNSSGKSKSSAKSRQSEPQSKMVKVSQPSKDEDESGEEEEEDDEQGATCGACGDSYGTDEFWICCDICERWFHGKCVKITPAKAEHIKQYKCPSCSSKRARV
ncbi:hypothetical protein V6N12_040164 [Hibiscus sabdariffa]|uniref:PHD finger protein ALFIN-LIKE n=1 Tax=Hibiscus sabdariffa TaxID=183260 RepID=A0ABR2E4S5_9ROSI